MAAAVVMAAVAVAVAAVYNPTRPDHAAVRPVSKYHTWPSLPEHVVAMTSSPELSPVRSRQSPVFW